jgi:hypothetical protein
LNHFAVCSRHLCPRLLGKCGSGSGDAGFQPGGRNAASKKS